MKRLYYILGMIAGMVSCSRETILEQPSPSDSPIVVEEPSVSPAPADKVTYTLRIGGSEQTKAAMSDEGAFSWAAGDEIKVLDANSGELYVFTAEGEGADIVFKAELEQADYNWTRAWSPASLVGDAEVEASISLPAEYACADVLDAGMVPLVATVNKVSGDALSGELSFVHMAGILRLTVEDVPAGTSTLTLSSPEVGLSGSFQLTTSGYFNAEGESMTGGDTVPVKAGYEDPRFVDEIKAVAGSGTITVNIHQDAESEVTVFLPVPTGSYNFTVALSQGGSTLLTKATTSAKSIARATFMKMSGLSVSDAANISKLKEKSAYGVYGLNGQYTASFETADQYSVQGDAFTLMKGWTFDKYTVSGVGASPALGKKLPLTVKYEENLTSQTHEYQMNAEVVKIDGDKVWLYDSVSDAGFIVSKGNADSGSLTTAARTHTKPSFPSTKNLTGDIKIPILLMEFKDRKFTYGAEELLDVFQGTGAGSTSSVQDYYTDNSQGRLNMQFEIVGKVTLPENESSYAPNFQGALRVALDILYDQGVRLAPYNSYIDYYKFSAISCLAVVFAGPSSQTGHSSNDIGCHASNVTTGVSDTQIFSYVAVPEIYHDGISRIGSIVHELGHTMGLEDFYDMNGNGAPLKMYSLMDYGNYLDDEKTPPCLSTIERMQLGWETDVHLEMASSGMKTMYHRGYTTAGQTQAVYLPSQASGEGFVCELRNSASRWDAALPEKGMVVFHIDQSDNEVTIGKDTPITKPARELWWHNTDLNTNPEHPLYYVVHANDRTKRLITNVSEQNYVPFPGQGNVTRFNPAGWDGINAYASITDIPSPGSAETMTFNVHVRDYPMINDPGHGDYSNGESFKLVLSQGSVSYTDAVTWTVDGAAQADGASVTLHSGANTIVANLGGKMHLYLEIVI